MSNISKFVKKYWPYAQISKRYGIPPIFALAQAALESGYGAKIKGNNVFNIKPGSSWKGKTQLFTTTEYHKEANVKYPVVLKIEERKAQGDYKYTVKDYFRAYDTPAESFKDHAKLLQLSRYKGAFKYKDNPEQFAREIAAGGYATATNYANDIIYIMRNMNNILKKKAA